MLFITGATSSIGRVLVKELAKDGVPVRILARKTSNREGLNLPGIEFVTGDITNEQTVRNGMQGCDQVVHLAAVVGAQVPEAEWWRVNRDGSRTVLQAAMDLGVKSMVQVSSLSVLGDTVPGELADENRPIDTGKYISMYQKTKHAADEIARELAIKGLPVKIVYPGFGFGCSWASSHTSMQEMTLLRMAAGKPAVIMGSGKNPLCVAYYKDTARGIRLALQKGLPGDNYILGNENVTFTQIWAVIAEMLGKEPPRVKVPLGLINAVSGIGKLVTGKPFLPQEIMDMFALNWNFSNAKARQVLGLEPLTYRQAMTETWQEYQAGGWKPG